MDGRGWAVFSVVACAEAAGLICGLARSARAADEVELPRVPTLSWAACGEEFPGVECATATVPLDYDEPLGATTTLALVRIPAADAAARIGTLFVNPGGPGLSGVKLVLGASGPFFAALGQGRFDVVGFDPRGVGSSEPLRCFDSEEALAAFVAPLPYFPYDASLELPYFDTVRSLAKLCSPGEGIAAHMSTADVARDLDVLRRAVGDDGLTYAGLSYGTFLGNTYANLFPDKVRALVFDGVLDPRLWSSGLQVVSDRVATQVEFEEFLRLCDEAGSDCALSGPEGAAVRYAALASALLTKPVELGDTLYSYDLLVAETISSMYSPRGWGGPDGFAAFVDALASGVAGVPGEAEHASAVRRAILERLHSGLRAGADYDNSFESLYANQCADAEFPNSFADYRNIGAFAASGSIFGPYWWWNNSECADWPVAEDRYTGPWTAQTALPVLVIGSYFDGVTAYTGAVATSELLGNSRLLSYAGWGHTAMGKSNCVASYISSYLVDGTLPPEGTVCAANPNPFQPAGLRAELAPELPLGIAPLWPGAR